MKNIIRRILLEETGESPLTPAEIALFKELNKEGKKLNTKEKKIDFIKMLSRFIGFDVKKSNFYYDLYTANYREKGDYENITPDEFISPEDLPARKVSNVKASEYSIGMRPFKGSNLEGKWGKDNNGIKYYVITSYNWYPIYLHKAGVWYKVTNHYSSTTSKQMYNVNPVKYDERIGYDVILVTPEEMNSLRRDASYEDIMKGKVENVVKNKESLLSRKPKFAQNYTWNGGIPFKVKFKVTDIRNEGNFAVVDVTIDDAGSREIKDNGIVSNKMIPSNGGYLRGELPNVTKEKVEGTIKNKIMNDFKDYIGKFPNYNAYEENTYDFEKTPDKHKIRFNFIHLKEQ